MKNRSITFIIKIIIQAIIFINSYQDGSCQDRAPDYIKFYPGIDQYHWITDTCAKGSKYWDGNYFCFCKKGEFIKEVCSRFPFLEVGDFIIDNNDNLWVTSKYKEDYCRLAMFDGKKWTCFNNEILDFAGSLNLHYMNNKLWITAGETCAYYQNGKWHTIKMPIHFSYGTPFSIRDSYFFNDSLNRIIVKTFHKKGFYVYHNGTWKKYADTIQIKAIKLDKENNIWISTDGYCNRKITMS